MVENIFFILVFFCNSFIDCSVEEHILNDHSELIDEETPIEVREDLEESFAFIENIF
jgi:hypothetical protein